MAEAVVKVRVELDEESAAEVRAKLGAIVDEAIARAHGFVAPYYRGDGSIVMLPIAEVERRRRAAAKALERAREVVDDFDRGGPASIIVENLRAALAEIGAEP